MRPALEELYAGEALERNDMARQGALRDQQRIEWQPATVDGFFLHKLLPGQAPTLQRSAREVRAPLHTGPDSSVAPRGLAPPMPFFDAGSEFLDLDRRHDCGRRSQQLWLRTARARPTPP